MAKEEAKKKTSTKTTKTTKTTKKAAPAKKAVAKKEVAKKTTPAKKTTTKKAAPKAKKSPVLVQESNQYGKMLAAILAIAIVLVACYCGYQIKTGNWMFGEVKQTEDEKKFEEEYESLNGTANEEGITNKTVDVIKDNNIEYITLEEADKMLEEGTGVIYFGYASCPWCRNLVPVMLDAVQETKLDKVYYVNLIDEEGNDLRSKYILNKKNKPKKEKDASMEYYNILAALSEHVSQYVLYTEAGEPVQVPEKRLSAPTVVAVKEGTVIGLYESTVEMDEKDGGAVKVISKNEKEEAKKAYVELFNKYLEKDDKKEE